MTMYRTILADPPWPVNVSKSGMLKDTRRTAPRRMADQLPYPTMTVDAIAALPVADLAAEACHLWLWTTNAFLEAGFQVMRAWGFTYLAPIHWIKPSGIGFWWVHRTQTLLFGYRDKCIFPLARLKPNIIKANKGPHSTKPPESYALVESVSPGPRLEMFARQQRPGWDLWGNEILPAPAPSAVLGTPAPIADAGRDPKPINLPLWGTSP
jgi:N6-adenosine-specific RNA methylase IME4